jgi:hydroxymethylpyrimidine pyrophosphatase-like HAD family hydrolase
MAVGDNFNDREMLAWAGTGIVMGNAVAAMKEGFEVTGTNDEAGLAQAIKLHITSSASGSRHIATAATRR